VLLEAQATGQERVADEPEGEVVAAVEVEAAEAVERAAPVISGRFASRSRSAVTPVSCDSADRPDQAACRSIPAGRRAEASPDPREREGHQRAAAPRVLAQRSAGLAEGRARADEVVEDQEVAGR
jgi:hypothetical protein